MACCIVLLSFFCCILDLKPSVFCVIHNDAISHAVRQMVMFSATWPLAVHELAQEFMDPNPIKVMLFFCLFFFTFEVPDYLGLTVCSTFHCRLLLDQKILQLTMM